MKKLLPFLILSQVLFGYHHHHRSNKHHRKGLKFKPEKVLQGVKKKSFLKEMVPISPQISLIGKISPIENQGDCGSCYDFSSISTLRDTLMLNKSDPGRLSFNYLLNCATDQGGCDGGYFTVERWLSQPLGAPLYGSDGPYIAQQQRCQKKPVAANAASFIMLESPLSFKDVAYVLSKLNRPIVTVVAASDNWQEYETGIMDDCSPNQIDHMVAIVGYDCKGPCVFDAKGNLPPSQGTYTLRNHWTAAWGENGFIEQKATDLQGMPCSQVAVLGGYFEVN